MVVCDRVQRTCVQRSLGPGDGLAFWNCFIHAPSYCTILCDMMKVTTISKRERERETNTHTHKATQRFFTYSSANPKFAARYAYQVVQDNKGNGAGRPRFWSGMSQKFGCQALTTSGASLYVLRYLLKLCFLSGMCLPCPVGSDFCALAYCGCSDLSMSLLSVRCFALSPYLVCVMLSMFQR